MIWSWGWGLLNGINSIIKEVPGSTLTPPTSWGHSEKTATSEPGSSLTRHKILQCLHLGLPAFWEISFCCYKLPRLWYFCYSSLPRLRYLIKKKNPSVSFTFLIGLSFVYSSPFSRSNLGAGTSHLSSYTGSWSLIYLLSFLRQLIESHSFKNQFKNFLLPQDKI